MPKAPPHRKLPRPSPKVSATTSRSRFRGNTAPSAVPASPQSHDSQNFELENQGYIDASSTENSNNLSVTNNQVDNRVDQSISHSTKNIGINHGTQIINHNYPPGYKIQELLHKVYFMVPFSRNEGFIGISQTLAWLEGKINGSGATKHYRVALWGMGGVGKTQDVLEGIYHYQSSQFSVFWVNAGSPMRFEEGYRKLGALVGLSAADDAKEDIRPIVKRWLEGPESGNWILVLDNADNILDFYASPCDGVETTGSHGKLADFIPHGTKGIVIITTRDHQVADRLVGADWNRNILDKKVMDSNHARQLFIRNYPKAASTESQDSEDSSILLLLEALEFLPLAVTQVTAFLRQNPSFSPAKYLNLFKNVKDGQKELLSRPFSDIRRESQSETVLTTFSISFRQLQEQSPLASSILNLIACIDNQRIPYKLLIRSSLIEESNQFAQLLIDEALSKLVAFSILSTSEQGGSYEMHSLVHISIKSFIAIQDMNIAMKQMAKALKGILFEIPWESFDIWALYHPHASALAKQMNGALQHAQDEVAIYNRILYHMLLAKRTYGMVEMAKRAVRLGTDILGPEHPDTLSSTHCLAETYQDQGQLKKAEELHVQVLELRKRILGPEHLDTLISMSSLAATYGTQGQLKKAEDLYVQVIELRKRVFGPEHGHTLISMHNLATTYQRQGQLKKAQDLYLQVIELQKRVFGPEHPRTLSSTHCLAITYQNQGQLKKAEDLHVQVIELRKRVLSPEHPDTLISMGSLAETYQDQGQLKKAEELHVQVIELQKRVLGLEHPHTLSSMDGLATTYADQGQLKKAEELSVQAIELQKRVLGPKHPDTLISMRSLATTYQRQGQLKKAEELHVQVIELRKRVFGPEHPRTLSSMYHLATTYWGQGQLKKAEGLHVQVMELQKRILGPEHPHTLSSMGGLATTYANQGQLNKAEGLHVQVMELRKRAIGAEHPDTLSSMGNLANTYRDQGQLKKAEDLYVQVMELQKRVLSPEHPHTLISMHNLATTYRYQGQLKRAEDLYVQVMELRKRVIGAEHPDTLSSMGNLANTYQDQGQLKKAEDLYVQVIELRKRVIGPEHPHTLSSMGGLATTYANQGQLNKAEELNAEVMEIRKRVNTQ